MEVCVYHCGYGCECDCCGHQIEVDGRSKFDFSHLDDNEDPKEYAIKLITKAFGKECVQYLNWEDCEIISLDKCYNHY